MTIDELESRVLIESGQFLIGASNIELNRTNFIALTKSTLAPLNGYFPVVKEVTRTISTLDYTYVTPVNGDAMAYIPEWISDLSPLRVLGATDPFVSVSLIGMGKPWNAMEKQSFSHRYIKPVLYIPIACTCSIKEVYYHHITGASNLEEISTLDDYAKGFQYYLDLLTGRFMQALGSSRSAFVLNDVPITMDASDMISRGKEKETQALTDMAENQLFYLSWA